MTDITQVQAPVQDPLSEQAVKVLRDIDELRGNLAWFRQENGRLERELALAQHDTNALHAQMSKLEAERGYYQRWTVELITELNTVGDLIGGVMKRAKQGVHRPNGAAPASAIALAKPIDQHAEEALPKVVTDGPAIPEDAR